MNAEGFKDYRWEGIKMVVDKDCPEDQLFLFGESDNVLVKGLKSKPLSVQMLKEAMDRVRNDTKYMPNKMVVSPRHFHILMNNIGCEEPEPKKEYQLQEVGGYGEYKPIN